MSEYSMKKMAVVCQAQARIAEDNLQSAMCGEWDYAASRFDWADQHIEELEKSLERVNKYADMLCAEYSHGSYFHRIGLDIEAAIKGDDDA